MRVIFFIVILLHLVIVLAAQPRKSFCITGYYAGHAELLDSFPVEKLTHLIYSFGHLRGNQLHIGRAADTACIQKMVSLKARNPQLKIILSLGGWGGCATCSEVFSTESGRNEFSASVKKLSDFFKTDGIDLDWEYPAISGYPGHRFVPEDKRNFTLLVKSLRKSLGKQQEISFAAGGFDAYIDSSVEWKEVMQVADKVYVMSYDLVNGFSTQSGHHTPLYSTPQQIQSADHAVNRLLEAGVPSHKIVIGGAFYGRMFKVQDTLDKGLYRPGSFYRGISYNRIADSIHSKTGFTLYWDTVAHAPFAFNPDRKILFTYDDSKSLQEKTKYVIQRRLGGIFFWQLAEDKYNNGLLDVLYNSIKND